jgi:exosortase/archaeosortase
MVFSKVGPNQNIEWDQIKVSKSLLSLIALFTFPFVVAHARHTWIILSIAKYIRVELDPYLPRTAVTAAPRYMRHWDESEVMLDCILHAKCGV